MANIVTTFRNMFRIDELRDRIIFTLIALLAVRVGSLIAIPGVDTSSLKALQATASDGGIFEIYNLFVGGAFENAAIFALGIMPYISASIILQIGGVVLPQLQKMQREGDDGRRKIIDGENPSDPRRTKCRCPLDRCIHRLAAVDVVCPVVRATTFLRRNPSDHRHLHAPSAERAVHRHRGSICAEAAAGPGATW